MTSVVHPVPGSHAALFYEREQFLHDSVAAFLAPAIRTGEPAVMIARQQTFEAVVDRLAPEHSLTVADVDCRVMFLDASGAMNSFVENGRLDTHRLEQAFAGLLDEIRQRHAKGTIWIYGEMVDLLCREGNHAAALGIEQLWNTRFAGPHVSVLCGYGVDNFDGQLTARRLAAVCAQHTHVIPHAFLENRTTSASTRKTIYIVEDDDRVRRALERLLRMHDLPIRSFASAESFLAAVDERANGCAIIDTHLPGMSGLDLQRWMADGGWLLPVIATSGSTNVQVGKEWLRLGARVYLPKPLDPAALLAAVTSVLSRDARAN